MKLICLFNSPIRLSTPKYFSWGQDAHWLPTPLLSLEFSQTFCQALSRRLLPSFGAPRLPLYAMVARIDYSRARLGLNKVAHCPSICHTLQVKFIAVSGMPILIRKTHYSQAKIGGTLRQLDKRNVYCSNRNVSVQTAGILLQTEIDGSCQTKVSVPVNTEVSTWHDYVLTKRKLDNQ